jgi:hypothetical protein
MKRQRLLINLAIAAVLGLVAFAVQTGALADRTGAVQAASCIDYSGTNNGSNTGDIAAVCGALSGNKATTYTVTVTSVSSGHITAIKWSNTLGQSVGPVPVKGTAAVTLTNGLTISFDGKGTNLVGEIYTFTLNPGCPGQHPVSQC